MTTNVEIVSGSHVVGNTESVIATLTTWHPFVDVYVKPDGESRADGTLWRVYAIDGATEALIAEGVYTFDGDWTKSQRVLSLVDGQGTTMQLRCVTDGLPTTGAMVGIMVGWDAATSVIPPNESDGSTHPLGTVNVVFATLPQWHPSLDVIVDSTGSPEALNGGVFELYASFPSTAGFPDCILASGTLNSLRQTLFAGFEAGTETFVLKGRTTGVTTGNVTARLIGHTGQNAGGGGGGGGTPTVKLVAGQNLVKGNIIRTNLTEQAILQPAPYALPHYAIVLENVGGGAQVDCQTGGILDPGIYNVGAGIACAIGQNAAGLPVRSTDPTCVSRKNWIGDCDVAGTIDINQRQTQNLFASDYGAIWRPHFSPIPALNAPERAQNTAAFVAMRNTIESFYQEEQYWPSGVYFFAQDLGALISAVTVTRVGGSVGTVTPAGTPNQEIDVRVEITLGEATVGGGGGTFRYAIDFGTSVPNWSGPIAIPTTGAPFSILDSTGAATGVTVVFAAGAGTAYSTGDTFDFTAVAPTCLQVTRAMRLKGAGSRYSFGTMFRFPDNTKGIMTWQAAMTPPGPNGVPAGTNDAEGCVIDGIFLWAEGNSSLWAHGLDVRTPTRIVECSVLGFGGDGIHISSANTGRPDLCYIEWTHVYQCQNGFWLKGGDSNICYLSACGAEHNRGWGYFDNSFLGTSYTDCHAATNETGAYFVHNTGISELVGCYSESDQPPSDIGPNVWIVGGEHGAGFTADSAFWGNGTQAGTSSVLFAAICGPALAAAGTNPPRLALSGFQVVKNVSVRVEVTTAGYPGARDAFGTAVGVPLVIRWSIDGGVSWTSGVTPIRADNGNAFGNSTVALGATGLVLWFTPYLYSLDNVYTGALDPSFGGQSSYFRAGSNDATLAAFSWGNVTSTDPGSDPFEHKWSYDATSGKWRNLPNNSPTFTGYQVAGGRKGVMFPGTFVNARGVWGTDDNTGAEHANTLGWADGSKAFGGAQWRDSFNARTKFFQVGDIILNAQRTAGAVTAWPMAWRASSNGGWGWFPNGLVWSAGLGVEPGYTVETASGLFRAENVGTTGGIVPVWAGAATYFATVVDNGITWRNMGAVGNPFEAWGTASEGMLTFDASAGGAIAFTYNGAAGASTGNSAFQRYKLTGAPGADFTLTIDKGAANSWTRTLFNTSGKNVSVTAAEGGSAVLIPDGATVNLFHDGTQITQVTGLLDVLTFGIKKSTPDNTANIVLFTTPALPNNATSVVDVLIRGKQNGNFAEGVTAKLSGSFFRNNAAAPVRMGTDDNSVKGTAGLGGSTFNLNISGNTIQVRSTSGVNALVDFDVTVQVSQQ